MTGRTWDGLPIAAERPFGASAPASASSSFSTARMVGPEYAGE